MKMFGIFEDKRFIAGTLYRFPNGSFIKFIGLDKSDLGKGLRSDVAYFNEVNKIDKESYRQIASRTGQVYMDYNPDAEFFVDEDIIPRDDCDFLQLTFFDNEMLPEAEREEILNYYKLGYGYDYDLVETSNNERPIVNEYWANLWQVYGLGNIGSLSGVCLPNWIEKETPTDARILYYGCDFGYSVSKLAIVGIFQKDNEIYLKQYVYATDLTNQQGAELFKERGYANRNMYCDYAEPKSIEEFKREGVRAVKCESKNDIKNFAIKKLNEKVFYVDPNSKDLQYELRHWVWDDNKSQPKKSKDDHLMDALCYAVGSAGKFSGNYVYG